MQIRPEIDRNGFESETSAPPPLPLIYSIKLDYRLNNVNMQTYLIYNDIESALPKVRVKAGRRNTKIHLVNPHRRGL